MRETYLPKTSDPPEAVIIDQVGCARCHGDGHPSLPFHRLTHPVELGGHTLTHYATCPTTGEPILLELQPNPLEPSEALKRLQTQRIVCPNGHSGVSILCTDGTCAACGEPMAFNTT